MNDLRSTARSFPDKPGVYIFKDSGGVPIYVGKANSLKKRVSSYFSRSQDSVKTLAMLDMSSSIEYIITSSELEALILESNLIKKERPQYNIILKDDKEYPYIKITVGEKWPRLLLVRKIEDDGARYFGPYNSTMVRETLKQLKRLFPIRWCKESPLKMRKQPCMYFHIRRCMGPCVGGVDEKEYRLMVDEIVAMLEGRLGDVVEKIRTEMAEASKSLDYERAARLRDKVRSTEKMLKGQAVLSIDMKDRDVIAFETSGSFMCALLFLVRDGKLIGKEVFYPKLAPGSLEEEILVSILKQYYSDAAYIPPEVLVQKEIGEKGLLEKFLSKKKGSRVRISAPRSGEKLKLVELASENAKELLDRRIVQWDDRASEALTELKKKLKLSALPIRIEAFDISNIQGSDIVGSMVAFVGGHPHKSDYRKFNVRSVVGKPDDVAAMYEVVKRRYSGQLKDLLARPDLILIDGGVGQVRAAKRALDESGMSDAPLIGLAKKEEKVHVAGLKGYKDFKLDSPSLKLLIRVRDEAHRFAVAFHRAKRSKRMKGS
jgi:excinuclease ABC subunit C